MATGNRHVRALLACTAVAGAGLLVAGCGGSSASRSTSAAVKGVSLTRAADVSSGAPGFKINAIESGSIGSEKFSANLSGSFDARSHDASLAGAFSVSTAAGSQSFDVQYVLADGTMYMKLPGSVTSSIPGGKPWVSFNLAQLAKLEKLPGFSSLVNESSSATSPGQYLDFLRATSAGSVKDLGQETVDGVQTTHYRAKVDISKLANVVPAADRQAAAQLAAAMQKRFKLSGMPVEIWVDQANLVRRLEMTLAETANGHSITLNMTENYSDYGAQPAPTIPSPGQTTDLLSLLPSGALGG